MRLQRNIPLNIFVPDDLFKQTPEFTHIIAHPSLVPELNKLLPGRLDDGIVCNVRAIKVIAKTECWGDTWAVPQGERFLEYDESDREWMEPLGVGVAHGPKAFGIRRTETRFDEESWMPYCSAYDEVELILIGERRRPVSEAIDFLLKHCDPERFDVIERAMDILKRGFSNEIRIQNSDTQDNP
jgi:hypothetical protein